MGDILFLAHRVPYPPDRGDKIRSYHLLRAAAELDRVHLCAFADNEADLAHAEALRPLLASLHVERRAASAPVAGLRSLAKGIPASVAMFASRSMAAHVAHLLGQQPIDTIFAFSSQVAQFVPAHAPQRFVMDFVDIDSAKFAAYGARICGARGWVFRREAELLARYEVEIARRAHLSLFVSEAEAALFRTHDDVDGNAVLALENGIDLDHFSPDADFEPLAKVPGRPLILFTGQMDYPPNIQAVVDFARRFDLVRMRFADARFAIVGRNPTPAVQALARLPGVIVTGEVPDVRPWLAAADAVVAPLQIARGVQNKVLEAMAMARPVVASGAAFEGIAATPVRDLVVADGAEAIAALILLLEQPATAARLGHDARARILAHYGWEQRLAPFAAMLGRAPKTAVLPVGAAA